MRPVLQAILSEIERLTPFSEVTSRVLELSKKSEVSTDEIIDVIRTDPTLTAKILRLANSPTFGARVEITSLGHAGRHVGPRALKSMVLASTASSFFADEADTEASQGMWEASVANAVAARLVSAREQYPDPELAFTVGLLQNTGRRVMEPFMKDVREEILQHVDEGLSLLEAEAAVLGMDHAQLGARVARRWELPAIIVDAILHHHAPHTARMDGRLCAITNLAEAFAQQLTQASETSMPSYGISSQTLEMIGGLPEDLPGFAEELEREIGDNSELVGIGEEGPG